MKEFLELLKQAKQEMEKNTEKNIKSTEEQKKQAIELINKSESFVLISKENPESRDGCTLIVNMRNSSLAHGAYELLKTAFED